MSAPSYGVRRSQPGATASPERPQLIRSPLLAIVLLTLAALALRLLALGDKSLLTDEGSSYYFSQLPLTELLWRLCDPHPPGYYLLIRTIALLGDGESWLRLPSVLAGALTMPLTFALVWHLLNGRTGTALGSKTHAAFLAAAFLALAPLHLWYSQEARPYAVLTFLAVAMVLAGLHWLQRPGAGRAALFVLAGWLTLFTEYGGLVAWAGLNLFVLSGLARRGASQRPASWPGQWIGLQALILLPFAAWWLVSPQRVVLSGPSYQAIFLAVQAQKLGIELTPSTARQLLAAGLLLLVALAVIGALLVRVSARFRRWFGSPWVAAAIVAALTVVALFGVVPRLYTIKRHLVVTMPFLSAAAAWALLRLGRSNAGPHRLVVWTGNLLLAALLLLSLVAALFVDKPPWREATEALAAAASGQDSVWVDELDAPVFNYYWRDRRSWQPLYAADLAALEAVPAGQRAWLIATITVYRNLHETLPDGFAASRVVGQQASWPAIELRAYDYTADLQPLSSPSQALIWGLDLPSPLDKRCTAGSQP